MAHTYAIIRIALGGFFIALLASCGQGGNATKADPKNIYTDDSWTGVAFMDYRDLTNYVLVGPFDDADQCIAAVNASGALNSAAGIYECCIIDEQYENYPGEFDRRKICDHNFQWSVHIESDFHSAYDQCADPTDLCNERGQLVRELVQNSQRNADIYASQIDNALQALFSIESDLKIKENARTRLLRAYGNATGGVSRINKQIHLDGPMKSHAEIERALVSGRDNAIIPDDERVFEVALEGVNRQLREDTLREMIGEASSLIERDDVSMLALELRTKVDAVLQYDPKKQRSPLNSIFNGMTSAEIAEKRRTLSVIGLIRIDKTSEPDTYYNCTNGIGNAYRQKYVMHAVDISSSHVIGSIELVGGAPPEKIESSICEGVGPPPDWSNYFEIADSN